MPPGDYPEWEHIDRRDFIERRFAPVYETGQHLTILGQTGWGKTRFLQELVDAVATPEVPATSLVVKPRDATVEKWRRANGYRLVTRWPPPFYPWAEKPSGYVLWPVRKPKDHYADTVKMWTEFRAYLHDTYRKGNRIVVADELHALCNEFKLQDEIEALYMRGRAMGAGVWGATQRPAWVPRNAYSAAEHVFMARDPDEDTRKRLGQIGGVNPREILHNMERLQKFEWLYFRRSDGARCIVGK